MKEEQKFRFLDLGIEVLAKVKREGRGENVTVEL